MENREYDRPTFVLFTDNIQTFNRVKRGSDTSQTASPAQMPIESGQIYEAGTGAITGISLATETKV